MPKIESILFLGSKEFGYKMLKQIEATIPKILKAIVTMDDRKDLRSFYAPIRDFAISKQIPYIEYDANTDLVDILEKYKPDLCVVNGWYRLISQKALSFPKQGFLAVHNSLLPKYRGGAPLVWALLNGDKKVGSSIFYLSEGMDDGDIVEQVELEINEQDYIGDVANKLQDLVLEKFKIILPRIIDGSQPRKRQNHAEASYCAQLNSLDGKIDWQKSATDIYNQIRAQSLPYPCAYSSLGEKTIRIITAEPFKNKLHGFPGQIVLVLRDEVVVACGGNTGITIKEVLFNDGREKATKILNSISQRLG